MSVVAVLTMLVVLGLLLWPRPVSLDSKRTLLTAGTLRDGDRAHIDVEWSQGQFYLLETQTQGSAATLVVTEPDGTVLSKQTDPLAGHAALRTTFSPRSSGLHRVVITSGHSGSNSLAFEIYASDLLSRFSADHPVVRSNLAQATANHHFADAQDQKGEQRLNALRQARAHYLKAADEWQDAGNTQRRLENQYRAAVLLRSLEQRQTAIEELTPVSAQLSDANLSAWAHATLGSMLDREGKPEEARQVYLRALGKLKNSRDADADAQATLENYLGLSYHRHSRLDEAQAWYEAAIDTATTAGNDRQVAMSSGNLGGIHYKRDEAAKALSAFASQLAFSREHNIGRGIRSALGNIGSLHLRTGNFGKALSSFADVAELLDVKANPKGYVRNLQRQAAAYSGIGDFAQAEILLTEALDILNSSPEKPRIASLTLSLAVVMGHQNKHVESLDLAHKASQLYAQTEDAEGQWRGLVQAARAAAASHQQDQLDTVREQLDGVQLNHRDSRRVAEQLFVTALSHAVQARTARSAQPPQPGAVDAANALFDCTNPGALATDNESSNARQALQYFSLAYCEHSNDNRALPALDMLTEAGHLALDVGDYELAARLARDGFNLIDASLEQVTVPVHRAQFLARYLDTYDIAISAFAHLHRLSPGGNYHLSALQTRQRAQARSLLNERQAPRSSDPATLKKLDDLLLDYYASLSAQQDLKEKTPDTDARKSLIQRTAKLKQDIQRVELELGMPAPLPAPDLNLTNFVETIRPNDLILVYWLSEQGTLLWALEQRSVTLHRLPPRATLAPPLAQISAAFREGRLGSTLTARRSLGQHLLGPVADQLDKKAVYLVLDGELNTLSFASLPVPGREQPLAEVAPSQTLPSLAFYAPTGLASIEPYQSVALISDPVYSAADERYENERVKTQASLTRGASLQRLAHAAAEAEAIAHFFAPSDVQHLSGFKATKTSITATDFSASDIIHMAVHGESNSTLPELSSLRLSRFDTDLQPLPDRLTPTDIRSLNMAPRLVVLSACDTATGPLIRGEGYLSLAQAFLARGAEQVVASLWPVPDDSTAELMQQFYQQLIDQNLPVHEALQQAQQHIRQQPQWRDPYYWSGFAVVGERSGK